MVGLNGELATFWTEDAKRDDCKADLLLNVLIVDSHNHFHHYMFDAALCIAQLTSIYAAS